MKRFDIYIEQPSVEYNICVDSRPKVYDIFARTNKKIYAIQVDNLQPSTDDRISSIIIIDTNVSSDGISMIRNVDFESGIEIRSEVNSININSNPSVSSGIEIICEVLDEFDMGNINSRLVMFESADIVKEKYIEDTQSQIVIRADIQSGEAFDLGDIEDSLIIFSSANNNIILNAGDINNQIAMSSLASIVIRRRTKLQDLTENLDYYDSTLADMEYIEI